MSKEIFGDVWEQVEAVAKEKGVNLIVDNKEKPSYIPKSRFDEIIGSKNELKAQVGELSGQLELLKKAAKGNEDLTKQIDELQKKNGDWESKYKNTILESAIKLKAVQDKAKDPGDLVKFLDLSKLEIDEQGAVKGLDEQLIVLKEQKSYLFDTGSNNPPPQQPPNPAGGQQLSELQQLEEQYAKAQKQGNTAMQITLRNQIFALNKK